MYRAPEIPPGKLYIIRLPCFNHSILVELQYRHEERTNTLQKEERYKAYRQWLI
jgi:hypothetical protein